MSDARRQINGSYGFLWLDGERVAEVLSFEAKVVGNRKEVYQSGSNDVESKLLNVKGEGSMKFKKVFSRGVNKFLESWKRGEDVRCKLEAKLDDPDAHGAERMTIDDAWFTEITAMQFEAGQALERDMPFGFAPSKLKMIETI